MQIKLGYNDEGELWKPRPFQIEMANKIKDTRVHACVVHRQAGKTEFGARLIVDFAFRFKKYRNPKALVTMRTGEQAFKYYFSRIHEQLKYLPEAVYMKRGNKDTGITIYLHRPHIGDTATINFAGIGNAPALKGGTFDLMILDEMSLYAQNHWEEIFEPMIKARKGKALCTSTMNGRNHFFELLELAKDEQAKGSKYYSHINVKWHESNVFDEDEMELTKKSFIRKGQYYTFLQEYENDPDAASDEEAPFAMKVSLGTRNGQFVITHDHPVIKDAEYVNLSVDIGKKGNMACWSWKEDPVDNRILIFDYKDDYDGLKELVLHTHEKYKDKYANINIIFPFDVQHPSMLEGKTYMENLRQLVADRHLRQITLHALAKVQVKEAMWVRGINFWDRCFFDINHCQDGINKISGTRFHKTKADGVVTFGKTVDNGKQHAADAFLYIAAAVEEQVHYNGKLLPEEHIIQPRRAGDYRAMRPNSYLRGDRYAQNAHKYHERQHARQRQRRHY